MSTSPFWLRLLPDSLGARLGRHPALFAVIQNTGWLFADRALRMLVGVFVGAWLARYLGPSQFGELSYILSFVAFFSLVAQLGLDSVAIRDMARNQERAPEILGTILFMRLTAGFIAWGAAMLTMAWLRPGDVEALMLTAVSASGIVFQAADTIDLWFQSQTESRRTLVPKSSAFLAASALKVAMIAAHQPVLAFVAVGLIETVTAAGALYLSYRRYPTPFKWSWHRGRMMGLLRESLPYLVAGLAVLIYMRIDQLMLREMVGEHELGLYSAALPLSTALYFIPMAISMSLAPTLARLRQHDEHGYERALARLFRMLWWLMLPLSVAVSLLAPTIVSLLYGASYAPSAKILAVHVFSSVPVALGVAQSLWIVNEGKSMLSLYRTVAGALSNIILNMLLIPSLGGLGAAIATLVSQTVAAVLANVVLAPTIFRLQMLSLLKPHADLSLR